VEVGAGLAAAGAAVVVAGGLCAAGGSAAGGGLAVVELATSPPEASFVPLVVADEAGRVGAWQWITLAAL
jgi:hypothetical protein